MGSSGVSTTAPALLTTQRPADQGFVSWVTDPLAAASSAALTAGTLYLTRLAVRAPSLISAAWVSCLTSGTPTSAEISLFTPDGTRRALSANEAAAFGTTGMKTISYASAYTTAASVSWVWVGILAVGGTFNLSRATSISGNLLNPGLAAAASRFGTAGTGLSATPSSITPANIVQPATASENWWVAIS